MSRTQVEVFVSEHAVPKKVEAMRALGAQVHAVPGGYAEAEAAGRAYASQHARTWISPYNDGQVIAGQGTLALEILEDLEESAAALTWVVPVGGGGLISGVGAALRARSPRSRLVGVQSEASAFAHGLFQHGTQAGIADLPSLADGLSGAVESGSVTIPLMREYVDEFVLVSEEEIARAVAFAWHEYRETLEGAAAAGLAALLTGKIPGRPAVAVMTGGNIQPEVHAGLIERFSERTWA
jgi:threonine dehydratase